MRWPRPTEVISLAVLAWTGLALLEYLTGWDVKWWSTLVGTLALIYMLFAPYDPIGPLTKKVLDKIGEHMDRKQNGSS